MRDPAKVRAAQPNGDALEARIDQAIDLASRVGFWPAKAAIDRESASTVAKVIERYRLAGWRIERKDDSRDGAYVQVEAP